jgi:hypothetical protein
VGAVLDVALTRMSPPVDGNQWRVEVKGGAADGMKVDCVTLEVAIALYDAMRRASPRRAEGRAAASASETTTAPGTDKG